jgi:two-component system response regulator CpxR
LKIQEIQNESETPGQIKNSPIWSGQRVLVVDDDVEFCHLVSQYLGREGFVVETVHTGSVGIEHCLSERQAIVVLDVMLPDINGFEVLRQLRAWSSTPVLMLTARGDDNDRILGLEMGADDYLPKPFNPRELSARIGAILRRSRSERLEIASDGLEPIAIEDVKLHKGSRVAIRGTEKLGLTTVEFDLLEMLLKSAGTVLAREDMVRSVLGREFSPFDRSLDTHISNLRKKLGPRPDGSERIKGVRGVGYLYAVPCSLR